MKVLVVTFLIVTVVKLISETFDMVGEPILPFNKLLESIRDDERIWDLFKNGITCTLNQVDSDNGMQQAKKFGLHSFEDGAMITAAIRPSFDSWREKFLNREPYSTGSEDLDEVLESTHHYILFQENLMEYFQWLGVTPAESIGLIKKISKKKISPDDFAKLEDRLREQWIVNTGSEDKFDDTWGLIQSCMAYGFACPHACATSGDMCYGAYLKVHYPFEYYCVALNTYAGDMVRTKKLTDELKYFNIELSGIKFRKSKAEYTFDKNTRTIYKGIGSVKYVNSQIADEIYALRDGNYRCFVDVLEDLNKKTTANSRQIQVLISLDFFSEFGDINKLLKVYEIYNKLSSRKSVKKDAVEDLGVNIDLLKKYSTKETGKMLQFDTQAMKNILVEYERSLHVQPCSVGNQISYQLEYLGYVDYRDSNEDSRKIVVMNLDTKYSPRFTGYCLKTGETCEFRVHKKMNPKAKRYHISYGMVPFKNGDILYMKSCEKRPRQRKDENGRWVDAEGFNWWLNDYEKISAI